MDRILICDDEKDIASALRIYLRAAGYETDEAANGREALELFCRESYQLVLLDVMMPVMDGISAMKALRESSNVPIILLTAKSEDSDKILGLDIGADDYITKPFNPDEVLARVRSQLRRYLRLGSREADCPGTLRCCGIEMNDETKRVTLDGESVSLTPTEYEMLRLFLRNPGRVFSPDELYRLVWKDVPIGCDNTVAVHIRHLRSKIEINPAEPRYLRVIWGQGYCLDAGQKEK